MGSPERMYPNLLKNDGIPGKVPQALGITEEISILSEKHSSCMTTAGRVCEWR